MRDNAAMAMLPTSACIAATGGWFWHEPPQDNLPAPMLGRIPMRRVVQFTSPVTRCRPADRYGARAGREPRLLGWVRQPRWAGRGFLLYRYAPVQPGYPSTRVVPCLPQSNRCRRASRAVAFVRKAIEASGVRLAVRRLVDKTNGRCRMYCCRGTRQPMDDCTRPAADIDDLGKPPFNDAISLALYDRPSSGEPRVSLKRKPGGAAVMTRRAPPKAVTAEPLGI